MVSNRASGAGYPSKGGALGTFCIHEFSSNAKKFTSESDRLLRRFLQRLNARNPTIPAAKRIARPIHSPDKSPSGSDETTMGSDEIPEKLVGLSASGDGVNEVNNDVGCIVEA